MFAAPPAGDNPVPLTPADVHALRQIVDDGGPQGLGCAQNFHEIIDIALHQLQRDLASDCRDEVIEDVQHEIRYRLWCAQKGL